MDHQTIDAADIQARAEAMVGELQRDGAPVFYIFPAGGEYREGSVSELVAFLIRNGCVR